MVRKAVERRYSARQDAAPPPQASGGFTDDHIINPELDIPTKILRPKWHSIRGGTPRPRNVFRILPVLDPDTGDLVPFRFSEEPGDYGDWLYGTYFADNVGVRNVCYLMGDNRYVDENTLADTPLSKLHANITKAITVGEGRPEWNSADAKLVQIGRREFNPKSKERPPLLTRPKFVYMLQVAVVSHEEKPENIDWWGINDDDPTILLIISSNAGMNLIAQLDRNIKADPVSLDAGLFIDVHSVDNPPPGHDTSHITSEFGYAITLRTDFNGMSPKLSHRAADVQKHVRWWDDIVYIPNDEEQVQLICNSDIPASAIMYGLGDDFGAYIPDSIRDAGQRGQRINTAMDAKPNIPKSKPEPETQPIATAPGSPAKGESVAESLRRIREAKEKKGN